MENQSLETHEKVAKHSSRIIAAMAIGLVVLAVILGAMVFRLNEVNNQNKQTTNPTQTPALNPQPTPTPTPVSNATLMWGQGQEGWVKMGEVPACDSPLTISSPADITAATNILYPGQLRSGNYKPHGGMRFDGKKYNEISVKLTMDAFLFRGSRYIEAGETQYMLDFITPCGIMFRFDHLNTLSPEFMQLVDDQLPAAKPDFSMTTNFNPVKLYPAETVIATAVGYKNTNNTSFDWGVYDLRTKNSVSQSNPTWAAAYANVKETAYYAVCWLDLLPASQKTLAKALPGGGTEGKTSDYCK